MEFDFKRFGNLLVHQWVTRRKELIWFALVLFFISFLGEKIFMGPAIIRLIIGFVSGVVVAHYSFHAYKTRADRCASLLLPCSTIEKYLAEFLFVFVLFQVTIFLPVIAGTSLKIAFFENSFAEIFNDEMDRIFKEYDVLFASWFGVLSTVGSYLFCFLFSLVFRRYSALKIYGSLTGIAMLLVPGFAKFIANYMDTNQYLNDPAYGRDFIFAKLGFLTDFTYVVLVILSVFLLVITYFRLKEERV